MLSTRPFGLLVYGDDRAIPKNGCRSVEPTHDLRQKSLHRKPRSLLFLFLLVALSHSPQSRVGPAHTAGTAIDNAAAADGPNGVLLSVPLRAAAVATTSLTAPPGDAKVTPLPFRWGCARCAREEGSGWRQDLARARWWFSTRGGRAASHSSGGTPTVGRLSGSSKLHGEIAASRREGVQCPFVLV